MNSVTIALIVACAALFGIALAAFLAARAARAELARLVSAAETRRAEAELARAELAVRTQQLADRDQGLRDTQAELADLRTRHQDAEQRSATATEAVARLEDRVRALGTEAQLAAENLGARADELAALRAEHAALKADTDGKLASALREKEALKAIRADMTREFQELAHATLAATGDEVSKAHQERLNALLTPFRDQVGRLETELRAVHEGAGKDRALLTNKIVELTTQTQAVSQEAVNLTRALKGDKQRQGAWGEGQLAQYLENMGYVKGVHYVTQEGRRDEAGDLWRPDVILKLPGGKCLVIDSKVSLVSYAAAVDAGSEDERNRHLREHARAVRSHIDRLAAKGYQTLDHGAVDWVMLFMPVEGAVSAAWAQEADIGTYAMERGIGIAYPTTLLMALKTVMLLWNIETRNANAESIADRAGKLYDKFAGFMSSFLAIGAALDRAETSHKLALNQLKDGKGNIIGQVEKLKELGARTNKSLGLTYDTDTDTDTDADADADADTDTDGAGAEAGSGDLAGIASVENDAPPPDPRAAAG